MSVTPDDNNSTRKFTIVKVTKADGSHWIDVLFLRYGQPTLRWRPAFHDLHRVLQAIAECEDEKYPPPAKGRWRLLEFLRDAIRESDYFTLARKYKIPVRDGDDVVDTNGADLARQRPAATTTPSMSHTEINWGQR